MTKPITRRNFMKLAGGVAVTAAAAPWAPKLARNVLYPIQAGVATAQDGPPDLYFAGTDGWISLPSAPAIPPFHPDDLAPAPFTNYIFGFRNITGLTETQIQNQKNKAQHSAPLFWIQENVPFRLQLTNLGLALRPDLVDAHTLHWHGFRNVIPFFDGEPSTSVSVPIGRNFTYVYVAHDPGTYMFHCHVEDVEHVQMGMTGLVFVRPAQDGNTTFYPSGKYAYNDGDGSTGYDREYAMFLSELWVESHWADSHIQLPEWSDYHVDFAMLNGRVYPDTIAPNGSIDPFNPVRDVDGDLIPTPGYEHLQYQPLSSLVTCNEGERVLLRFANLGFTEASMHLTGIKLRVVGKDATLMRGIDGTDTSYVTNTLSFGAGESIDAIFEAPAYQGPEPYDTYLLYNRSYSKSDNLSPSGYGGQMTEVRVYPTGTLGAQTLPNT
ncbi:MAG: multicopper oxidase domain-containing protein [Caldilineaceae bacterium]